MKKQKSYFPSIHFPQKEINKGRKKTQIMILPSLPNRITSVKDVDKVMAIILPYRKVVKESKDKRCALKNCIFKVLRMLKREEKLAEKTYEESKVSESFYVMLAEAGTSESSEILYPVVAKHRTNYLYSLNELTRYQQEILFFECVMYHLRDYNYSDAVKALVNYDKLI